MAVVTWEGLLEGEELAYLTEVPGREARTVAAARAPPEARGRAQGPRSREPLRPPGGVARGRPPRRARRRRDRDRQREDARVQPPRPRRARRGAEAARALPLPDEGARAGPGALADRAGRPAREAGDLRRRHRARAPLADPQVGERDPDQPGHAPRRRPPAPRPLGGRPLEPPLRGRRRGARLPRRLRLPRRQRAPAAAARGADLRRRPAVPARLGDDRQPGRARALPARRRRHRDRRRRGARGRRARSPSGTRRCSTRRSSSAPARSGRARGSSPSSSRAACGRSASPRAARRSS